MDFAHQNCIIKKEKNFYPYEPFVQTAILDYLNTTKKYGKVAASKELWEHGVDIKVKNNKYSRYWLVEVKGGSTAKNANSVDTNNFVFGLGQIITRIQSKTVPTATVGSNKYGVAYPDYFIKFLKRKRLHWNLCKSLNLYVFLVDKNGCIEEYDWKRIKREFYQDSS